MKTKNLINLKVSDSAYAKIIETVYKLNLSSDEAKDMIDNICIVILKHNFLASSELYIKSKNLLDSRYDFVFDVSAQDFNSSLYEKTCNLFIKQCKHFPNGSFSMSVLFKNLDESYKSVDLLKEKLKGHSYGFQMPEFKYSPKHRAFGYVSILKSYGGKTLKF